MIKSHGFADLDSQFEEVRLSREADRVAQEQREDGRKNAAETTAKADESKAAIKKHLVDAKKLRWTGAGFLYHVDASAAFCRSETGAYFESARGGAAAARAPAPAPPASSRPAPRRRGSGP